MFGGIYKILVIREGGNSSGPSNRIIEAIGKLFETLSLRNPASARAIIPEKPVEHPIRKTEHTLFPLRRKPSPASSQQNDILSLLRL